MSKEKPSPQTQETLKKPGKSKVSPEAPTDEKGGFKDQGLPEPTRYGDWEVGGRCSDF